MIAAAGSILARLALAAGRTAVVAGTTDAAGAATAGKKAFGGIFSNISQIAASARGFQNARQGGYSGAIQQTQLNNLAGAAQQAASNINKLSVAAARETDQRFEAMEKYAEVNPRLSLVYAQRERDQYINNRYIGERIATSASHLEDSDNYRNRNTADIEAGAQNIYNVFQTGLNYVVGTLLAPINEGVAALNDIYEFVVGTSEKSADFGDWAHEQEKIAITNTVAFNNKANELRKRAGR